MIGTVEIVIEWLIGCSSGMRCGEVDLLTPVNGVGGDFATENIIACGRIDVRFESPRDKGVVDVPKKDGSFFI